MARIPPLQDADAGPEARAALDAIRATHGRVTNMKRTLAREPVALRALMTWYDVRDQVLPFLGSRLTMLFAHAISGGRTTFDLAGQVALITGAAHGQGRASALALAREGVRIAALDVARPLAYPGYPMGSSDELATLAQECRALGVDCLTFAADVRDDVAVSRAVHTVAEQFGHIDILFNLKARLPGKSPSGPPGRGER